MLALLISLPARSNRAWPTQRTYSQDTQEFFSVRAPFSCFLSAISDPREGTMEMICNVRRLTQKQPAMELCVACDDGTEIYQIPMTLDEVVEAAKSLTFFGIVQVNFAIDKCAGFSA